MATIFRPPTIFRNWRRDPNGVATAAQDNVTQNRNVALLLGKDTFFRGAGDAPSYDWPNPTLAKSRVVSAIFSQVQVWQNGLVNLLVGKDTFFRGPGQAPSYDWPNPTLAKSRLVAAAFAQAQVWQNGLVNLLVGKDTFFRGPGQAPVYDWPNPLRVDPARFAAVQALVTQNLLGTLLAVTVAAAPFTPLDQPNPRGAINRVALNLAPVNLLTTTLAGQGTIYGGPGQVPSYAWPNPRGAVNRAALDFVPPYLFGTTLQALPVGAALWPQPIGRPPLTVYDPPNLLSTLLAVQAPFYQTNWPNPIVPGPRFALKVEYAASQNFYPPTPPPPPSTTTPEGRIIHFGRLMIRHS